MNEPKIKIQAGRQMSSLPYEEAQNEWAVASESEQVNVPLFPSRSKRLGRGRVSSWVGRMKKQAPGQSGRLWMPALLATFTGVLLGVCLLVLFKGQAADSATAPAQTTTAKTSSTTAGYTKTAAATAGGAKITLPGAQLFVWQVGSFNNQSQAQTALQQLADRGVQATIRNAPGGAYQLYAGVAADKASGSAIASELQKAKVSVYAKPYTIESRLGSISGLNTQEAAQLLAGLKQETNLAAEVLPLAETTKRDSKSIGQVQAHLTTQTKMMQTLHTMLAKANLTAQAAQLDKMQGELAQSIQLLSHAAVLPSENALAAFYVDYETLTNQLIQ